jgi:hypothetical protein
MVTTQTGYPSQYKLSNVIEHSEAIANQTMKFQELLINSILHSSTSKRSASWLTTHFLIDQ